MVEVIPYQENLADEWDRFVEEESLNGTFLHTRAFFRHNPVSDEADRSLIFRKKGQMIGVIPAVIQEVDGCSLWSSHAYATYGGFVVSSRVGVAEALELVDATISAANEEGASEIRIRNPFRIFNKMVADETDYAMWARGFRLWRRDVEITMSLKGVDVSSLDTLYNGRTRNALRQAERNCITVRISDDYTSFWSILTANLVEKHDAEPTHTLRQFMELLRLVGDERIKLFAAYHDEVMVAGIVVFVANRRVVHAQYIGSEASARHLRPVNMLVHEVAKWSVSNGSSFFNLGMVTEPDGRSVNLGLCSFKEGFGARGVLRETMHLPL